MWSGARESKLARLEMLASISTNVLKHREPLMKVLRGQQRGREEKMPLLLRQRLFRIKVKRAKVLGKELPAE